jgi:hypothetical protein
MLLPSNKPPLAGLVPATHVFSCSAVRYFKTWMAGTSPAKGLLFNGEWV